MPEFTREALRVLEWTVIDAVKIGTRKLREEITEQLTKIERKLNTMETTQEQFDAKLTAFLADLDAQTTAIDNAVQAIIDKNVAAGKPLDLSAESAQIDAAQAKIDGISAQLPSAPTPTPAPAPAPGSGQTPAPAPAVQQTTPSGEPLPPATPPPPAATTPAP